MIMIKKIIKPFMSYINFTECI